MDAKFMPGLKVMRLSIDIPIEHSNEFLRMFGAPDRASPVWCAVARLATPAGPLPSGARAPERSEPEAKPRTPFRELPRSQQAALRCGDDEFQLWIATKYHAAWDSHYYGGQHTRTGLEAADLTLKEVLAIKSKRELDTDHTAAARWDALLTDFDTRGYRT